MEIYSYNPKKFPRRGFIHLPNLWPIPRTSFKFRSKGITLNWKKCWGRNSSWGQCSRPENFSLHPTFSTTSCKCGPSTLCAKRIWALQKIKKWWDWLLKTTRCRWHNSSRGYCSNQHLRNSFAQIQSHQHLPMAYVDESHNEPSFKEKETTAFETTRSASHWNKLQPF